MLHTARAHACFSSVPKTTRDCQQAKVVLNRLHTDNLHESTGSYVQNRLAEVVCIFIVKHSPCAIMETALPSEFFFFPFRQNQVFFFPTVS